MSLIIVLEYPITSESKVVTPFNSLVVRPIICPQSRSTTIFCCWHCEFIHIDGYVDFRCMGAIAWQNITSALSFAIKSWANYHVKATSWFLRLADTLCLPFYVLRFFSKTPESFRYCDHNFFVASRILFGLDKSVNPCDDFYQYACGGWEAKTAIPGYHACVSQFSQMREAISMQLRGMYDTSDIYMLIGQPNFSAELHVMYGSFGKFSWCFFKFTIIGYIIEALNILFDVQSIPKLTSYWPVDLYQRLCRSKYIWSHNTCNNTLVKVKLCLYNF